VSSQEAVVSAFWIFFLLSSCGGAGFFRGGDLGCGALRWPLLLWVSLLCAAGGPVFISCASSSSAFVGFPSILCGLFFLSDFFRLLG
jgi:hypothetical protein